MQKAAGGGSALRRHVTPKAHIARASPLPQAYGIFATPNAVTRALFHIGASDDQEVNMDKAFAWLEQHHKDDDFNEPFAPPAAESGASGPAERLHAKALEWGPFMLARPAPTQQTPPRILVLCYYS